MQLKKQRKIQAALATASCTLLTATPQLVNAADDWKIDAGVLNYAEKDRVTVVEPAIFAKKSLGDDEYLNFKFVYDAMSGASPTGASPTDKPQSFSTPSGQSQYTVQPNELPKRSFSDERIAGTVEWEKPLSRTFRSILGGSFSSENDYSSLGLSSNFAWDVNNKLTTFAAGASLSLDQVEVRGTIPDGLALLSTISPVIGGGEGEGENEGEGGEGMQSKSKTLTDLLIGVTQVLTRRTLMQLNYTYGLSDGYLTDPYKILSVVDGTSGETLDYRYEKRPGSRTRQAVYWKTVYHLPEDVVHFSYRYYWDDWNVQAHTFDLTYRFELGGGSYLAPHLRYYTQTAADFYHHSLVDGQPVPQYASADYRLAEMQSTTYGLKLGLPLDRHSELALRAEYMQQTGNNHPNDAIGLQRNQDLYPGLDAYILSLTYTTKF
jgi:hypothetical protein